MIKVYCNPNTNEIYAFFDPSKQGDPKDSIPKGSAIEEIKMNQKFEDIIPVIPDLPLRFVLSNDRKSVITNPEWEPVLEVAELTAKITELETQVASNLTEIEQLKADKA